MRRLDTATADLRSRLHARLAEQGWAPLWSLLYLGFLFMNYDAHPYWLGFTFASMLVFLPLYFIAQLRTGRRQLAYAMAVALLGYLLLPQNTGANTYLVYAGAMLGASGIGLRALLKWIFVAALVFALAAVGQAPGEALLPHVLALALVTVLFALLARRRLVRG